MSSIKDIYQIRKQMGKYHKKINLLNKKKIQIGLDKEEEKNLDEYRIQFWILHEELIETHLNITVIPYLTSKESSDILKDIQKIIPWKGGLIRRDQELEEIINAFEKLPKEQKEYIAKKLETLHLIILQSFESFCSTNEGYLYIQEASKVISDEEDGNILDVLVYLDARYRELAELLDIELQEVEIMWEDENE